jgi:hypothetical protein
MINGARPIYQSTFIDIATAHFHFRQDSQDCFTELSQCEYFFKTYRSAVAWFTNIQYTLIITTFNTAAHL